MVVGCGGAAAPSAELARGELERQQADLVVVSHGLGQVQGAVAAEISASRLAWAPISGGLPATASPTLRAHVAAATARAAGVAIPLAMGKAEQLSGPAGGIAALLRSFAGLSLRGWRMTGATLAGASEGPRDTARFMRANAGLYIACVYDGHYNLAAIGETLRKAYLRLGGPAAFGARLTQAQVEGLARVYSPARARLHPQPAPGVQG